MRTVAGNRRDAADRIRPCDPRPMPGATDGITNHNKETNMPSKKKSPETQAQKVLNQIRLLYVKALLQDAETSVQQRIKESQESGNDRDVANWQGHLQATKEARGYVRAAMAQDIDEIMNHLAR